jgi:competence ComEA-like helix-hairpin-helix protein
MSLRTTKRSLRATRDFLETRLYRVQDRLAITRFELGTTVVLLLLYLVGITTAHVVKSVPRYGDSFYAAADSTFFALSAGTTGGRDGLSAESAGQHRDSVRTDSVDGPEKAVGKAGTSTEERFARIPLNRASAQELTRLSGVGPTIAGRIVAYRSRVGRFRSVDQLLDVKGIGPRKLEAIREQVVIDP